MDYIQKYACLVRISGPDPKGLKYKDRAFYDTTPNGATILSASGFMCLDNDKHVTVVSSATLFAPFLDAEHTSSNSKLLPGCKIEICFENNEWKEATLVDIVHLQGIREVAESLVMGSIETKRGVHFGSIAKLHISDENSIVKEKLLNLKAKSAVRLRKGETLFIVSSPFGLVSPYVFQNSVTTGIVSNTVPFRSSKVEVDWPPALILTDARCLPGSEGGAVFDDSGNLIGMVAPSLQRGKSFSVEFGAIFPIDLLVHPLRLRVMNNGISAISKNIMSSTDRLVRRKMSVSLQQYLPSVVIISVGSAWGSGVVISKYGHVITCAHVIKPYTKPHASALDGSEHLMLIPGTKIRVGFRDAAKSNFTAEAKLLFCAKGVVDVALLKLDVNFHTRCVKMPPVDIEHQVIEGQKCLANGHAIFDPSFKLPCTVSVGNVSRVVKHPKSGDPVIVQSCATVFNGNSGGLLADENGYFIGLLTSNSKLANGEIIPTINFSIPVNVLRPLIENCQANASLEKIVSICRTIDSNDKQLVSLWMLEVDVEPAFLPDEINEKSSAFADFVKHFGSKL